MDFLEQILNSKTEEEADTLVTKRIEEMNSSKKPINQLGFLDYGKNSITYEGFIPLNTRIKYSSMNVESYGMNSIDFFYDFAHFLRNNKINKKSSLIYSLETFVNWYFGYPGKTNREEIFNDIAWNSTTTDEEYFEALKNNKLGDLKGKGAAECTERGALVQQLLSMFDTEVYYCMGCVDLGDRSEGHCFNIVKRKDDYALLDYSIPVSSYNQEGNIKAYYPFVGTLSSEEFEVFTKTGVIKSFQNYEIHGNDRIELDSQRRYIVGEFDMEKQQDLIEDEIKENSTGIHR